MGVVAHRSMAFWAHTHGPDRLTGGLVSESCCAPVGDSRVALRNWRAATLSPAVPVDAIGSTPLAQFSPSWQDWKSGAFILKASTVVRKLRKGVRLFWTWKIRRRQPGRPVVPEEVRGLIRTISRDNALRGAPRIHSGLLQLGIEIGETSVNNDMVRLRRPPSQAWGTSLHDHVKGLASVIFFTVPSIRFQILYASLVLAHDRRRIVHFAATAHPTSSQ